MLDVEFARSHFPALATDWALLDNAGGSVTPRSVIDRIRGYMSRYQVQLGASYPLSRAVAASNGFPILFTPITLRNHAEDCQGRRPAWIDEAKHAVALGKLVKLCMRLAD